jgi:hypothetical protein
MINLPFKFPSENKKIEQEVSEFRRLSSTERFLRICSLSGFCERLLEQSPQREAILAERRASEEEWQRIHRELFKRHGV